MRGSCFALVSQITNGAAIARAFWADKGTIVVEYDDNLGRVIGRKGSNIGPFQKDLMANGIRLIVRLTAEAEAKKRQEDAEFAKAVAEGKRREEELAPARAIAAEEAAIQRLLRKKELAKSGLARAVPGSSQEESFYRILDSVEKEIKEIDDRKKMADA